MTDQHFLTLDDAMLLHQEQHIRYGDGVRDLRRVRSCTGRLLAALVFLDLNNGAISDSDGSL
jgi:hypothetical protein